MTIVLPTPFGKDLNQSSKGEQFRLTREMVAGAASQDASRMDVFPLGVGARVTPELDVWDMWQLAARDGSTVEHDGRAIWFFLAAPILSDPEDRHDLARIRYVSFGADGWRDHGWLFPEGWSPGSREWSGSAVLADDGKTVTMYFTATGRRGERHSFEQRLFETQGELIWAADEPAFRQWSEPVESIKADGKWYKVADQLVAPPHGIWGFRDPGYFLDPKTGIEHLLFVGSAGWTSDLLDGVIGLATRTANGWQLQSPIVDAVGVNSELERPHVLVRDGRYYCFWSSHGRRHAPDLGAPTGLYGIVADVFEGPWRPLNGTGLVLSNPADAPFQAYCWWVTGEGSAISFVDYVGMSGTAPPQSPIERRATFGGTAAPFVDLKFDGDVVLPRPYRSSRSDA